jgi:hypothetical protein
MRSVVGLVRAGLLGLMLAWVGAAFAWLSMASLAAAEPGWPAEISGGARLPDGTMVLVDDETPSAIFLWDGDLTHPPVPRSLGGVFDDLEGVAADSSGAIYLLTSHSLTRRGRVRPERRRLARWVPGAAASQPGVGAGTLEVIDDLTPVLLRLLDTGPSQLSLEGLAWYPPGDQLFLGARAPLREGKALVVGLRSASRRFVKARTSQPSRDLDGDEPTVRALDLGGRGIRDLAYDPWRGAIWVLAGPVGERGSSYALFLWKPESERIEAVAAPGFESLAQPEGVMVLGPPDPVAGESLLIIAGEGARPLRIGARLEPGPSTRREIR